MSVEEHPVKYPASPLNLSRLADREGGQDEAPGSGGLGLPGRPRPSTCPPPPTLLCGVLTGGEPGVALPPTGLSALVSLSRFGSVRLCYDRQCPSRVCLCVCLPQEHMQTHQAGPSLSSQKPRVFKCDACEKAFAKPSQLERHSRIHTGSPSEGPGRDGLPPAARGRRAACSV